MAGYFLGLMAVAVCCSAVELLTPAGEGGGVSGHMKWMSGLCLLCVLITPVCQLLSGGEGVLDRLEQALDDWLAEGEKAEEEYADQWQDQYKGMDIVYAQASISALLQQKFEIAEKEVNVRLEVDEAAERITAVSVGLSGQAVWVNTHELEAYVEQMLGCVCTTYIE
jgi:hypothetical protein